MLDRATIDIVQGATSIILRAPAEHAELVQESVRSFDADAPGSASAISIYARFLEHCAQTSSDAALVVLDSFCLEYGIPALDIHIVVQQHGLDEGAAQAVLRAYFLLWNIPAARHCYFVPDKQTRPALFEPTTASLMAMFGGQPGTSLYLGEAKWLLDVYRPLLLDFVKRMSAFLSRESEDSRWTSQYNQGLDVFQWLSDADSIPDAEYLVSAPVSMPLAGLIQLMQIMVLYKTLGLTPGEFSQCFTAAVGHSQGIVMATALSIMSDEESFGELSERILGIHLLVGALPQLGYPRYICMDTAKDLSSSSSQPTSSSPLPMVLVRGIDKAALEVLLSEFNSIEPQTSRHMYLAVINSYDQFIVAGATVSAAKFIEHVRQNSADPEVDQSRVPFAQRKPVISVNYVEITVPYHCRLLESTADTMYGISQEKSWLLNAGDMKLPVRAADDGHDIRMEENLTRYLLESICVLPVNWPTAISAPDVTHIIDFGTGGFAGFGQLARRNLEGRGIPVICAGALIPRSSYSALGTKGDLYQCQLSDVVSAPNWREKFGPRLVRTVHDDQVHIDTRMHHILGSPTVMVAGMTPTTANQPFVAAINRAGYHSELAGGGINSEADMVRTIKLLAESIEPGQGITLNCIYINPRQWSFQFPALLRLRSEGLPIVGLCIGGGVPSFDAALEIIGSLRSAGIRHVSFKPSTAEAIRHVVKVAQASEGFPVVLQWTGGRAGGHHSYEDFHQPILQTYGAVRACDNIALVAGSGFGDAEGTLPYLTGDWSAKYGRAPMPFDGILLGSRVMVAKEALTSPAAKEMIVAAQGLSDADWHQTYGGASNGMTSIISEYGEINHLLQTRSSMYTRYIHEVVLSHPREKRQALLLAHKDEVISRLNSDYMRPWFGKKTDGRVVDLEDMTYAEVASRLVELMYIQRQQRWIHNSLQELTMDFIGQAESRLSHIQPEFPIGLYLLDMDPIGYTDALTSMYPKAATQLMASEDVQFFIQLCKRRGQKPPPFVPVLDADFGTLFLKDSSWHSEDLDATVDNDPQRVGIQQGPVAAQYSTVVDEPIKEILDGIYLRHIASLLDRLHGGDESVVPIVEYIGAEPLADEKQTMGSLERVLRLPTRNDQQPDLNHWLQKVAGPREGWLRALLTAPVVVQGSQYVDNYVRRLVRPRPGRTVTITEADGCPESLVITDSAGAVELELVYHAGREIHLAVHHMALSGTLTALNLVFNYEPSQCLTPIHASKQLEDQAIRQFFIDSFVASSDPPKPYVDITHPDAILTDETVLDETRARAMCAAVGNRTQQYLLAEDGRLSAPVELVQILSALHTMHATYSSVFGNGQAKVVHLYTKRTYDDRLKTLYIGDRLETVTRLAEFKNTPRGKRLTLVSNFYRDDEIVMTTESAILSDSYFIDMSRAFRRDSRQKITVVLPSDVVAIALGVKEWFVYHETPTAKLEPTTPIEFCLDSVYHFQTPLVYSSVSTTGSVSILRRGNKRIHFADVDFQWSTCTENPVIEYLNQYKMDADKCMFDDGGYSLVTPANSHLAQVTVPSTNLTYAKCSMDGNPFHLNPYIADYAAHSGTITHGLWTGASTRAVLESIAAGGEPMRIRAYNTDFVDVVLPNDTLETEVHHVGMNNGRMSLEGKTSKVGSGTVMTFTAEVEQPATAYVFTGQGSQVAGMGMDLYRQSLAAQAIWDRANAHMLTVYDVDLLDIVQTNPTEHTVYFDGKVGEQIKKNYLALSEQSDISVLPGITAQSSSYTLQSPTGLLNSTQFTQVALVASAMASVADLRSQGLVQKDALFAGHSLGEYAALAALGDVFTVEDVLDIVFYRGLIMQSAVPRDEHGRSEFGMAAVNPSRVSQVLNDETLQAVVDRVHSAGSGLLQVVNYNVSGQQYVVAGTLTNLAVLRMVLDGLEQANVSDSTFIIPAVDQIIRAVMSQPVDATPVRSIATVPLEGIDVPFHSEQLADRVSDFRSALRAKISPDALPLDALCGRYLPNLTAEPFELSKTYLDQVYQTTQSPVVGEALNSWDDSDLDGPSKEQIAAMLLVELLAYQLASPVQWIKTQEHLFDNSGVERVVEIGASPVLSGMAAKSLQSNPSKKKRTSLLHFERDRAAIYYEIRPSGDAEDAAAAAPSQPKQSREQPQQKPAGDPEADPHPVQEPAAQDSAGSDTSGPITDVSLQAVDVVHAMVAFKLKQKLSAISALKNIKTLVGGNSTLQNEVVADLQKEFGSRMPDKPEEMALQELGAAIGASDALGKCTQPLVARMFSSKMPGGFSLSSARSILETAYGLGPQRQDALLLVALTMEPASRLSSDAEATAWLDKAAQAYATRAKISYSRAAGAAASGSQAQGSMVSSTEMKKMQQQQSDFVRQQIEVLARYAGIDLRKDGHAAEAQQAATNGLQKSMDAVSAEFGDELISGVQPCFDARKARPFDSYWNWIRQDVFEWIQQAISVCIDSSDDPQPATVISEAQILRIRNCADVELLDMLAGMVTALGTSSHTFLEPARQLVHRLHKECQQALHTPPVYRELLHPVEPQTRISPRGMEYSEIPRSGEPTFAEYIEHMRCERESGEPPFVHLREKIDYHQWDYCPTLTSAYFEALSGLCSDGMSFAGKTALVTGCGRGSIGAEVIRGLLMGGAKVLATTSSYSRRTTLFFEDMYKECGSRGSELILVPFNQGSVQDIDSLVRYIFDKPSTGAAALGWNLDYVFPFAASSDIGSTSSNLGSWSELVQRIALTNVVRLLGRIKAAKKKTQRASRPSLVVMPLSPNHSTLGGDGLYGECKIGLEATFNRWEAERWEGYLSVAGAVIGWTRGTGLMSANNLIMGEMEALGMRTFSAHEMAFNILGLVYPQMAGFAHRRPVWGDFCGGMGQQNGLGELTKALVSTVEHHIEIAKQLTTDTALEYAVTQPLNYAVQMTHADIALLTKLRDYFPVPKPYESLDHLHHLQDMVNLDKVVVITGYGEVGPYGNAETRWEIESKGELSAEGCIELAWAMGLIRHANEQLPATGQHYVGWVDAKSGEPVRDDHVKAKYEEYILDHTGIRLIEPELAGGYDPDKKQILREVHIEHDMAPFEANAEEAAAYKKMNGDKVDIWENSSGGPWSVRFLKGALIRVPVSVSATRLVAGLLPTGWSFQRLGIPEELLRQIDPISVYSLIAVVEALARAGITDPYELYQYFHVSEIGNTVGSTAGGMQSAIGMFRNRRHDMEVQSDIMQETFISTVQAWTNMFLMSSAGPVKPVTGACATSLLSIDAAVETIQSGKAKMMIAGGVEDFCEESTTEFANMGASSNSVEDFVQGRTPSEMCRPCTSSRGGFVEGQGAGIVILMSASAALKCGAPIYGVVGMSATATDKQGRSAPAPGKGIMGSARETKGAPSRLLDLDYRWRKFQQQAQSLDAWKQEELDELYSEAGISESELALQVAEIDGKHGRQRRALQDTWGNEFWKENPRISPLRGSLAVWGLTADDIGLASFHGTSTKANDQNESEVLNAQLAHIGRTPGNVLPAVCQKWLVGHSKAAAAGSALNGIIQSLRTGIIPGNRNADNIDQELKSCDYSLYLSKTIQTPGIRAALVKSFGFGQVGGEALIVHSDYLLATLSREQLEEYNQKLVRAGAKAERFWQDVLVGNRPFIQIKDKPPYTPEQEQDVLLNPQARAQFDPATNEYRF